MTKYKALITDLDGTLLAQNDTNGLPSPRVREMLEKAKEKIHVGIATGRPPIYTVHLFDTLKLTGPSIMLNGAIILDSETQDVLHYDALTVKDANEIIQILIKMKITFTIDELNNYALKYSSSYKPKNPLVIFVRFLTDRQVETINKAISNISTATSFRVPDWEDKTKWALHIGSVTATKQIAIVKISEMLNILPEEIIAIGDSYNDFPLLMAAGLKVAMGNAVEDLKAIADYIAPSVENDGVADVIEKFVL